MDRTRSRTFVIAACALLGLAAFQTPTPPQDPPKPAPAPAPGPDQKGLPHLAPGAPLRIAGFHGADKEKQAKQYEALSRWLSKDLGRPVEIVLVENYSAAVDGLLAGKIELAWLDGENTLRAEAESKGYCWPMFTREEDLKGKTYFIANKKHIEAKTFTAVAERNPMPLETLAAMKPAFAGLTFSFGAKASVSSHWMPRYFLERPEVGIDPEKGFKQPAAYAPKDGDAGVIANVGSGAVAIGAVSSASWEAAKDEQKLQAPVIFVTPEYMDCSMVLFNRVGPTLSYRICSAFIKLDPKIEDQQAVLELFGTKHFVRATPDLLAGLRAIRKSAKERKLLE